MGDRIAAAIVSGFSANAALVGAGVAEWVITVLSISTACAAWLLVSRLQRER